MLFPSTSTDDKHDFLMSKIRDEVRNSSSRNVSNIKRGYFRYRCPSIRSNCWRNVPHCKTNTSALAMLNIIKTAETAPGGGFQFPGN